MRLTVMLAIGLFAISFASSEPTLTGINESYQPKETVIGSITGGEALTEHIRNEDLTFFEGRKKVFFETKIKEYNNTYYFYAYTTREGNFSIEIGPLLYKEGGTTKEKTLRKEIEIQEKEIHEDNTTGTKILSIKPGIIDYTKKEKETIRLTNEGKTPITITYNKETITLNATKEHTIQLNATEEFSYFDIETYKTFRVPLIPTTNTTLKPRLHNLKALTTTNESLNIKIPTGKKTTMTTTLTNTGNASARDITITTDIEGVSVKPTTIEELGPNESIELTIELLMKGTGRIQGAIEAVYQYKNESGILTIPTETLIIPKGFNEKNVTKSPLTCKEEGGTICGDNKFCDGEATYSKDGQYCCLANCIEAQTENEGSNGTWIGIALIAVLLAVGYWGYRKQKKAPKKDPVTQATQTYPTPIKTGKTTI